jgi:catechol 2,3-dioxygenase-like lactoylglutathione lyase family enzyme
MTEASESVEDSGSKDGESTDQAGTGGGPCTVGAFSISLAVKDLAASTEFYRRLGFTPAGGDGEAWSILVNGNTVIGLFHGMFEDNILTFNPGWAGPGQSLDEFEDVRAIRDRMVAAGVAVEQDTTQDSESGPASFVMVDPDGNPVLIDQHV